MLNRLAYLKLFAYEAYHNRSVENKLFNLFNTGQVIFIVIFKIIISAILKIQLPLHVRHCVVPSCPHSASDIGRPKASHSLYVTKEISLI